MSIANHTPSDLPADSTLPIILAPAANAALGGSPELRGLDETAATEEEGSAKPIEYCHVVLPVAGSIRVRYSRIEPLKPRRVCLEDEAS